MDREEKIIILSTLFLFFLIGLAYILVLPPYEGFDETAHYSYISLLADEQKIPDFRETPLDATVEDDRLGLPRPYSPEPPFEENEGITYHEFFSRSFNRDYQKPVYNLWKKPAQKVSYHPGKIPNWEGQHPPLYYFLMVIPYRLSKELAPGLRILFLRIFSMFIASLSIIFWFKIIKILKSQASKKLMIYSGVIVLFFPSLFFDFARIGNDSLAALLFTGVLFFLISTYVNELGRIKDFLGLALILGLGLVTKLFFFPIWLSAIAIFIWMGIKLKTIRFKDFMFRLLIVSGVPIIISGWWFALFYQKYGIVIGSQELYSFWQTADPPGENLSLFQFLIYEIRALFSFVITFLWSGTWSWIRRPLYAYLNFVPLIILTGLGFGKFVKSLKPTETKGIYIIATFLIVPLLLGFIYHTFLIVKYTGWCSGTGGYYLYFVWPIIGMFFAFSFEMIGNWMGKVTVFSAFILVFYFDISGWWTSALVYSGILEKIGPYATGVGFVQPTLTNIALVINRLKEISFPSISFVLYASSSFLKVILLGLTIWNYKLSVIDGLTTSEA